MRGEIVIMLKSWLPEGGENLFQGIKLKKAEAISAGKEIYDLAIGQPKGPALLSAREAAAAAIMSPEERMHEYQDNGSPGIPEFARRFVQAHIETNLSGYPNIDFLPIPGIKPMLGLIPLACGAAENAFLEVATTTDPGYPTPKIWFVDYLTSGLHYPIKLCPQNSFLFNPYDYELSKLFMVNYPHNPSGQIATADVWERLCTFCVDHNIRLFNDGAYHILAHTPNNSTLTDIAVKFPDLSWAEAFSASKAIGNGTGWRVGAIVGSSDFIGDIKTIKGNTDSGFVAPMAAGVIHAFENDREGIEKCRHQYAHRIKLLCQLLISCGMQLSVEPQAGFFTLWRLPKKAFGEDIKNAKHFNYLMIEKTGIVGVHFDPYIRYAVCGDVESMLSGLKSGFEKAAVSY